MLYSEILPHRRNNPIEGWIVKVVVKIFVGLPVQVTQNCPAEQANYLVFMAIKAIVQIQKGVPLHNVYIGQYDSPVSEIALYQ